MASRLSAPARKASRSNGCGDELPAAEALDHALRARAAGLPAAEARSLGAVARASMSNPDLWRPHTILTDAVDLSREAQQPEIAAEAEQLLAELGARDDRARSGICGPRCATNDFLSKRELIVVSLRRMKGERLGEFEEFTLLAVRALGDNTYAVPIQQYVEEVTARTISIGSIYAALARLEDKGFLRSSMSDAVAQRGGKSKRVYTVTPSGLQTARDLHRVRERIWNAIARPERATARVSRRAEGGRS